MKKCVMRLCLLAALLALSGCSLWHQWQPATCEAPKICARCGKTEGAALGHIWWEATCETAKTCTACGKTEGTALGHSWQPATCLTAKTCSTCQAPQGEAKGHSMLLPNFQGPAACADCGYTEGEPLPGAYEGYPVTILDAQPGMEYAYEAACAVSGYTTIGKLTWENYQVFASDETHEAAEGYLWHSITATIVFSDENALKYGVTVASAVDDRFWRLSGAGDGYTDAFSVSWHGQMYDQCQLANSYGAMSDWEDKTCTYTAQFAWRVPEGYDGFLILFYNGEKQLSACLETGDKSLLVFRFA